MKTAEALKDMIARKDEYSYSDWFGEGNLIDDIESAIKEDGEPERVLIGGFTAALVYADFVRVVGYDGSEYQVDFTMNDKLIRGEKK